MAATKTKLDMTKEKVVEKINEIYESEYTASEQIAKHIFNKLGYDPQRNPQETKAIVNYVRKGVHDMVNNIISTLSDIGDIVWNEVQQPKQKA